jgi:hypothetical protein
LKFLLKDELPVENGEIIMQVEFFFLVEMENQFGLFSEVPKVAVANACVSPRVNNADPCTDGK